MGTWIFEEPSGQIAVEVIGSGVDYSLDVIYTYGGVQCEASTFLLEHLEVERNFVEEFDTSVPTLHRYVIRDGTRTGKRSDGACFSIPRFFVSDVVTLEIEQVAPGVSGELILGQMFRRG